MSATNRKLIPPDGGWGWVIVFAYALNHLILVPVMTSFGLVFKDTFNEMGFTATDGSVIINTNAAASMMTGLVNGPLLKYFGYRKVSIAGAFFTTLGLILTAYATTFAQFLVTYGLVTSLGMGMGMSSYPYALNIYFIKRRNYAAGIAMTITGLGPVLMPQLISLLLYLYDVHGAMLVLAAVAANSFIAALLLQPVKWHMIRECADEEENAIKSDDTKSSLLKNGTVEEIKEKEATPNGHKMYDRNNSIAQSVLSIDHDLEVQAIYGVDTPLGGSMLSLNQGLKQRKLSESSFKSINDDFNRRDSLSKTNEKQHKDHLQDLKQITTIGEEKEPLEKENQQNKDKKEEPQSLGKRIASSLVTIFDLTLFNDPIYVNIMLGMSFAVFAEINFSLLTPFILADFNLSTVQIATFLSTLSIADLCFRFLSPFIGDFLKKPPRIMYMFSLLLLVSTRFTLLLFSQFEHLLGVALILGVAKGIRTVYWTLVIPSYVPMEKLANASGIQMVVNGLFILAGGPLIGVIRDVTGTYRNCIFVINTVTLLTFFMWTTELLYLKYRKSRKSVQGTT